MGRSIPRRPGRQSIELLDEMSANEKGKTTEFRFSDGTSERVEIRERTEADHKFDALPVGEQLAAIGEKIGIDFERFTPKPKRK